MQKGIPIGKHRAAKLMKEAGIKARKPRKFKVTTDSAHKMERAPNLVERRFNELASAPNHLWVSELTYIWTQQGWLYLNSKAHAWLAIVEWIEYFYNNQRQQSSSAGT
jgi:transposase InsO family protein